MSQQLQIINGSRANWDRLERIGVERIIFMCETLNRHAPSIRTVVLKIVDELVIVPVDVGNGPSHRRNQIEGSDSFVLAMRGVAK